MAEDNKQKPVGDTKDSGKTHFEPKEENDESKSIKLPGWVRGLITVLAACGGIGGIVGILEHFENKPPNALLKLDPIHGRAPLDVLADASDSRDPDGDELSYTWLIDGELEKAQEGRPWMLKHTFNEPGEHTILVKVSDGRDVRVHRKLLNVESPISKPIADFSVNRESGNVPFEVEFHDRSEGEPSEWFWDFGDGSSQRTERNPIHTYTTHRYAYRSNGACFERGTYTVTLRVRNEAGESSKSVAIEVKPRVYELALRPEPYPILKGKAGLQHNPGCSNGCGGELSDRIRFGSGCLSGYSDRFDEIGYYFEDQEVGVQAPHVVTVNGTNWVFKNWSTTAKLTEEKQLQIPKGDHWAQLVLTNSVTITVHYEPK